MPTVPFQQMLPDPTLISFTWIRWVIRVIFQKTPNPTQPDLSPTQPSHNPLNQVNPSTQANAPGSPQDTPLQNIKGTIYSAHNPPSVKDNVPVIRRPAPNYTPEELERFSNYTADWHKGMIGRLKLWMWWEVMERRDTCTIVGKKRLIALLTHNQGQESPLPHHAL